MNATRRNITQLCSCPLTGEVSELQLARLRWSIFMEKIIKKGLRFAPKPLILLNSRRGTRDSNPGNAINVRRFSRPWDKAPSHADCTAKSIPKQRRNSTATGRILQGSPFQFWNRFTPSSGVLPTDWLPISTRDFPCPLDDLIAPCGQRLVIAKYPQLVPLINLVQTEVSSSLDELQHIRKLI